MSSHFEKRSKKMFTLISPRLRVELPVPGEAPNTSLRFDRAGYIADVILDGGHHFCASEPLNLAHPSSGGRGLCNEWVCDVSAEAEIGEYFPKFGVGLIRKEEDFKYVFHRPYRDVVPFPVTFTHTEDTATFVTQPVPCLGYALQSTKTIIVKDNTITMTICAENVGEKPLSIKEFCHNFISIDGMALGSDYHLSLPSIPDQGDQRMNNRSGQSGSFRGEGHGLTFCEFSPIATDVAFDPAELARSDVFCWKLRHDGAKMWVQAEDFYQPAKFCVWAVDHIVAPEVSIGFTLQPGQSQQWTRRWTFDTM
jgi:hypothetical protein